MKILTIKELNEGTAGKNIKEFIEEGELTYVREIENVAKNILSREHHLPIILISGPSGSAKTTTALRLGTLLENSGKKVHLLSMDNYFRTRDDPENEVDEDGRIDYESPKRLDMKLLNEHLEKLWKCEEIEVPTFDFSVQRRLPGKKMHRAHGEFVIMEGIHALNPEITGNIGDRATTVYVSVRTRLENAAGELLHPSKIRLMRRIVRDKLFRGREITATLDFYKWVERGEERFIMPYKHKAMFDIDTFISYEPAVYKSYVLGDLRAIKDTYPGYANFEEVERFLDEIEAVDRDHAPMHSLVREFAGGSSYEY